MVKEIASLIHSCSKGTLFVCGRVCVSVRLYCVEACKLIVRTCGLSRMGLSMVKREGWVHRKVSLTIYYIKVINRETLLYRDSFMVVAPLHQ